VGEREGQVHTDDRGSGAATAPVASAIELEPEERLGSTSYELFILLLSILSIGNLVIYPFLAPEAQTVILLTDGLLSLFFLLDFLIRLKRTKPARRYLVRDLGWADFLAIFPVLRVFRIFRLVRVVNRLRRFGGARLLQEVRQNRSTSAFGITIVLVILVVEVAGAAIVTVEAGDPDANIRTASDAIWWAYVTITTVGYGDRFPVTDEGRILGMLLLTSGVALFSVLTGFVANFFLGGRSRGQDQPPAPRRPLDPNGEIAQLVRLLDEQEERSLELRRRLATLGGGPTAPRDDQPG
jgi:voltage-gated potassium channel